MEKKYYTLKLWHPLVVLMYPPSNGYIEYEGVEISPTDASQYKKEIKRAIKMDVKKSRGLRDCIEDKLLEKIVSLRPSVDEWEGKLYGVTVIKLKKLLTNTEIDSLIYCLLIVYSDGWGAEFEQKPIPISNGEIYTLFYDYDNSYFIKPENEFKNKN